jgi:hypothetical protein
MARWSLQSEGCWSRESPHAVKPSGCRWQFCRGGKKVAASICQWEGRSNASNRFLNQFGKWLNRRAKNDAQAAEVIQRTLC